MSRIDITNNQEQPEEKLDPPWFIRKKSKKERLEWFKKAKEQLEKVSEARINTHVNNILWYLGEYDRTLEYRMIVPGQGERMVPRRVLPRIFSHLYDITEQRVAKLSRYKPTIEVVPTNSETSDWQQSRLYKTCLDAVSRRAHMDLLMQEIERWCAVCGEVLTEVVWNPAIGDRVKRGAIERVGDVEIKLKAPWTWLPAPSHHRDGIRWGIDIVEVLHIEEARKKYDKASLEPDTNKYIFSFNQELHEKREDEVVVYRVIEPPNEYNDTGCFWTIINDELVGETETYPYSHNEFPFEWHTDIDVPGRLFPISFYQHLQPIQHVYNRLTSIMVRNALLVGHPHILMPKGAAKIEAFTNAPTAIEFSGTIEPKIATFNSIPNEFFTFRKEVLQELGQIGGIQGVSRGAPPSGVRAASMLRFYEEQEEQRASTQIIKHNELIRKIFLKAASIIADYYPLNKERLIRVVGKENQYKVQTFIESKPSSEYDVIIVNSTGFAESKAGRLEELQLIQQMAPGVLTPEQIADVLELKNTQKAYDIATAALRQAEEENELFLDGKDVAAPTPYQDLIVHWRTHMILFNSSTWENHVSDKDKEKAYLHMATTERLMEEKAEKNPTFNQLLATIAGYPAFWVPTPKPDLNGGAGAALPQPMMEPPMPMGPLPPGGLAEMAAPAPPVPLNGAPPNVGQI